MDDRDTDRLELLDRIAKRIPELDIDQQEIAWQRLDDGTRGAASRWRWARWWQGHLLRQRRRGRARRRSLDPIIPGHIGCIVIKPDGSRYVAQAVPDPLAQPR